MSLEESSDHDKEEADGQWDYNDEMWVEADERVDCKEG